MALGTNIDILSDTNTGRPFFYDRMKFRNGNPYDNLMKELELRQWEQSNHDKNERENDLNIYRSGSAPPTIEGSSNAISNHFQNLEFLNEGMSEEEMRSHPAYLSYYYSHESINPRLPPPLLSREEWRMHQRLRSVGLPLGEMHDWRKTCWTDDGYDLSLFLVQPDISMQNENKGIIDPTTIHLTNPSCQASSLWLDNKDHEFVRHGGVGLGGMGIRRKSFADILHEGFNRSNALKGPIPRQASRNVSYEFSNSSNYSFQPSEFWSGLGAKEGLHTETTPNLGGVHNHRSLDTSSYPTVVGSSSSRSSTPEFHKVSRTITPNLSIEKRYLPSKVNNAAGSHATNGESSSMNNLSEFAACLPLIAGYHSKNGLGDNKRLSMSQLQHGHTNQPNFQPNMFVSQQQLLFNISTAQKSVAPRGYASSREPANFASTTNSRRIRSFNEKNSSQNARSPVNTRADNHLVSGAQNGRCGKNMQLNHHYKATNSSDVNQTHLLGEKYVSTLHGELSESQKAQLDALISEQKQICDLSLPQEGHGINEGYYEGQSYLLGIPYQGAPMTNSLSFIQFRNPMLESDLSTNMKDRIGMTLLEEFKNKNVHFELSDIVGHVVEFSMDQYGSRFIQQKLETATDEEKMEVFPEINPHVRALMTDVFGNYVIQKIFVHGTHSQRNILARQMKSHVLQLSLQMYGCRVIQKALETLDVEEKTQMVAELDGSVLKCVRDQNGNHVIQKCVECVPEDKIQFIISSFFGQVVPLSTHPYGCRVIQRVLKHCNKEDTKNCIMVEIMRSICTLAQDQYGNYVIQHVIQHGKPEEIYVIITKLAGQIVKMSQHKFASNVIEKCLTFCSPEERQVLVNEMLVSSDQSEPLQSMMKDPFGNYVVQKVLETCDEQTRELILSRIKLYLNDMKNYTYVKHVVTRVEKLLVSAQG